MTPVDVVIWCVGLATLFALTVALGLFVWAFVRQAVRSIDFTRRCWPLMRVKPEASRWSVAYGLTAFTWGNIWDTPDQVTFPVRGTVYWSPKDRNPIDFNEDDDFID